MKKILALLLILAMTLPILAGCGGSSKPSDGNGSAGELPEEPGETPENPGETPDDGGDTEENGVFVGNDDRAELCVLSSGKAIIEAAESDGKISVKLTDSDSAKKHTVRVPVDSEWDTVKITEGKEISYVKAYEKNGVSLVDFKMTSDLDGAVIEPVITKNNKELDKTVRLLYNKNVE